MLHAGAANRICSRMMDADPSGQLLFRSVEAMWNMLEMGDQEQLAAQLDNLTCIRYFLEYLIAVKPGFATSPQF